VPKREETVLVSILIELVGYFPMLSRELAQAVVSECYALNAIAHIFTEISFVRVLGICGSVAGGNGLARTGDVEHHGRCLKKAGEGVSFCHAIVVHHASTVPSSRRDSPDRDLTSRDLCRAMAEVVQSLVTISI
jgi:hypothetical protein